MAAWLEGLRGVPSISLYRHDSTPQGAAKLNQLRERAPGTRGRGEI